MMSKRQAEFRADYRPRISPWYSGLLHVAVIYAIGFAALAYCIPRIHNPTWGEWLVVPVVASVVALFFGANDMDGTVVEEKIYHMAGAETPHELTIDELCRLIRAMGREPVERTTVYETVTS